MSSAKQLEAKMKKLLITIKKKVISLLNNNLPDDIAHYWVTSAEMHDRLVWSGVSRLLQQSHVEDALRRYNQGGMLMAIWPYNGTNFYRCRTAHLRDRDRDGDGEKFNVPIDQRYKAVTPSPKKKRVSTTLKSTSPTVRIAINPVRDYFVGKGFPEFESINRDLEELEEKQTLLQAILEEERMLYEESLPKSREFATQTSSIDNADFDEIELDPDDSNYFMQGSKLDDFIRLSSAHAAKCHQQLMLIGRDTNYGCFLRQTWICPCCSEELVLENCDMVRSAAVAQGAAFSRLQPDFNLRMVTGAALSGINVTKLQELLQGTMGIKLPTVRNIRNQMTKVRSAIDTVFEGRKVENRKEHVAAVREMDGYKGDVTWEKDGVQHSTCAGPVSHDGAGCTRVYNNRHRGRQSAFVVNSRVTSKPLALVVSQTNCIRCTRALNRRIRNSGGVVTVDQIGQFSMEHKGKCYRNSNLNPASAEEHQASIAARDLVLDENGAYRGDDIAIFCLDCNSDNDTRASQAIIREQNEIMGTAADDLADHVPDLGHVLKCLSNSLFKLREVHKSLKGANCLSNLRIKAIVRDVRKVLDWYKETGVGDVEARQDCLDQIDATIPHHCGDHTHCVHERFCSYLKVKNEYPDFTEEEIKAEAFKISKRALRGKDLSLHTRGIATVQNAIRKKVNHKNVDKIASGGCSNLSKSFWNQTTKFTEGKRLNSDHTDAYITTKKLTFCRVGEGNVEKTHDEVTEQMSLKITTPQVKYQIKAQAERDRIKKSQQTEEFKERRCFAKYSKTGQMGKEDTKKAHRSGKVSIEECAKSNMEKIEGSKRKRPVTCTNCKLAGHNALRCKMPKCTKRSNVDLIDFDVEDFEIKEPLKKRKLNFLAAGEWLI